MKRTILLVIAFSIAISQHAGAELITAVTSQRELITFDSATPDTIATSVAITGLLDQFESLYAIDFRPSNSTLYGLGNAPGSIYRLYTLDTNTGVATQVGSDITGVITGTFGGFDFNPSLDLIRIVTDSDQNLRIDPNTGVLINSDTSVAYAAGDSGFGTNPNIVGSAYNNNSPGAANTSLFGIDSNRDVLVLQDPPNNGTLNTVGALGVDFQNFAGFDVSGASGTAFASSIDTGFTGTNFYSIDLTTGGATLVGEIGSGLIINDFAAGPSSVPEPSSIAVLAMGACAVYRFRKRNSAKCRV